MAASAPASILAAALVVSAGSGYFAAQLATPKQELQADTASIEYQASVERRLDDMQAMLEDIDRRVRSAALVPIAERSEPAPLAQAVPTLDAETLAQVERVAAALDSGAGFGGDTVLIEQVDDAVQRLRDLEREERRLEREEERAEFLDERLNELQVDLGLDSYQVGEMHTLFTDSGAKREEAMDLFRNGDWMTGRDQLDALREETDTRLSEILTPTQLEGYEEAGGLITGGFGRGGGGGRGRGGPGGR